MVGGRPCTPPGPGYGYWRVKYKDTEGSWRTVQVARGDDPDAFFAKVEARLDHQVVTGSRRDEAARDMRALADRYLEWLAGKDVDYVSNRANLIDKWVLRAEAPKGSGRKVDADLPVVKWGAADSARWIGAARRAGLSAARVEDIGVALAGMRSTAQRMTAGERWMDPSHNPLEGVDYSRRTTEQAARRDYVPETSGRPPST